MKKLYYRTFQASMRMGSRFLKWRTPELLKGPDSILLLSNILKDLSLEKVLIVTDPGIMKLGLLEPLCAKLDQTDILYFIYGKTIPNPTIDNIEEALALYTEQECEGIIAFGGGSVMDCAKGVGARIAQPTLSIPQMRGLFKVKKEIPPLFAVPTTAGTGSEGTVAAVLSNPVTHEKYAVNDLSLIPKYAVLDPCLTIGLPPHITAQTGMDALTHAVEAYIGKSNTKETEGYSKHAVALIFKYLFIAYEHGDNLDARTKMLQASYFAGLAFTRAYVGNIHAIAHTLGGFYSVPHGLANAVILPHVLEYYGQSVHQRLAELADLVGITKEQDSIEKKANAFIHEIKQLNKKMQIPNTIEGIQEKDIPVMIDRAYEEANPLYPVPKIFSKDDFLVLYNLITP
ncbi:iron-containing alcohol dehydrogenase [Cytobacillus purgationiresistens]|uniref:Alcohol dehydrogenase class IV n=1 Tax=Cytobacillus purgationiresistens TaxID=863449 RepID=A0ABU0ARJ8_9BACI|nr:iron-containing alcohol dehydrogenase [Cytobacillus purgationiresistens]MDQ0273396.1 alcohol dehydrogenase class IV [Cytobacillus purgationiresistens]